MVKGMKAGIALCAAVALIGMASQSLAGKSEGPPPEGFKDKGPAVVGTLTFNNTNFGVAVDVMCKGNPISLSVPFSYDLQTITEADVEGYALSIQGTNITAEMVACYPDLATNPNLVIVVNTVTKFKAIPSSGTRNTVNVDVVMMRRIPR